MLNRREMISASAATLLAASARIGSDASPNPSILSNHFALGQMLQNMRASATTVLKQFGSFADVFTDQAGINARMSRYYDWDARRVVGPQRAFKDTVAPEEDFESITDWPVDVGAIVIDPSDTDPMVGKVAELDTGGTRGNTSALRKYFGVIPATFGVSVVMGMVTPNRSAAEATEFQAQNGLGHLLKMRMYLGAVQFFYNGAWTTQFTYGGNTSILSEWWMDAMHNGGSNYTVRLFAGTQELPGFTGSLPGGTLGEDGWVSFVQYSSAVADRKARVGFLQVGTSALPANMDLVSVAHDMGPEPTVISLAVMFEDVSAQTVLNTDLNAWVSKDGGSNWHQVKLASCTKYNSGVLDVTKPVYLVAGQVALPPNGTSNVCCRITSANGRYFSLHGYAWKVDA